jgi:hypothetical protein
MAKRMTGRRKLQGQERAWDDEGTSPESLAALKAAKLKRVVWLPAANYCYVPWEALAPGRGLGFPAHGRSGRSGWFPQSSDPMEFGRYFLRPVEVIRTEDAEPAVALEQSGSMGVVDWALLEDGQGVSELVRRVKETSPAEAIAERVAADPDWQGFINTQRALRTMTGGRNRIKSRKIEKILWEVIDDYDVKLPYPLPSNRYDFLHNSDTTPLWLPRALLGGIPPYGQEVTTGMLLEPGLETDQQVWWQTASQIAPTLAEALHEQKCGQVLRFVTIDHNTHHLHLAMVGDADTFSDHRALFSANSTGAWGWGSRHWGQIAQWEQFDIETGTWTSAGNLAAITSQDLQSYARTADAVDKLRDASRAQSPSFWEYLMGDDYAVR